MFSKIKKVLTSLALAASLVLAPMNVYAETKSGTYIGTSNYLYSDSNAGTPITTLINVNIASSYEWTVVVPGSFDFNSVSGYSGSGSIALDGTIILGDKTLTVEPKLQREMKYSDAASHPINITVTKGGSDDAAEVANNKIVSFTKGATGAATLEVSIVEDTWKLTHPEADII